MKDKVETKDKAFRFTKLEKGKRKIHYIYLLSHTDINSKTNTGYINPLLPLFSLLP